MKFSSAVILAVAGAVSAANINKRTVDPAQATISLVAALPASLQALAVSNPTSAAAVISSEIVAGPPAWFTSLPAEVQTYFITQGEASATASASSAAASAVSSANIAVSSAKSNISSILSSASSKVSAASKSAGAAASSAAASSSSSSAGAAMPTALIGSGIMGAVGALAMLAL